MDVLIYSNLSKDSVEAEIIVAEKNDLPFKKEGWKFNWKSAYNTVDSTNYILKVKDKSDSIEGVIQLLELEGMLLMNLLEIAPHNIGKESKQFEYVAGCLIAFGCYKSFELKTNYRGFLSFETKTKLREWYKEKYYAEDAMGNRMFIWPEDGIKLINEYLNRKI